MRQSLRKAQRSFHRARADQLAGQILRSLEHTPEDVYGRDDLYVRRYRHLDRLDAIS